MWWGYYVHSSKRRNHVGTGRTPSPTVRSAAVRKFRACRRCFEDEVAEMCALFCLLASLFQCRQPRTSCRKRKQIVARLVAFNGTRDLRSAYRRGTVEEHKGEGSFASVKDRGETMKRNISSTSFEDVTVFNEIRYWQSGLRK